MVGFSVASSMESQLGLGLGLGIGLGGIEESSLRFIEIQSLRILRVVWVHSVKTIGYIYFKVNFCNARALVFLTMSTNLSTRTARTKQKQHQHARMRGLVPVCLLVCLSTLDLQGCWLLTFRRG